MRPFTREDVISYANTPDNTIASTSGGLSMANGARAFLDRQKPLIIGVADSMGEEPREIVRYSTWEHLTNAELKPYICGAFEPAILRLVEKTKRV